MVVGPIVWFVLVKTGTEGAAWDYSMEKLIAVPVAVAAVFAVHVCWGIVTIPWRLCCEQRSKIAKLSRAEETDRERIGLLESNVVSAVPDQFEQQRLEIERLKLIQKGKEHDEEWNRFVQIRAAAGIMRKRAAVDNAAPGIGRAWLNGVAGMLESNVRPAHFGQLQHFFNSRSEPESGEVLEAQGILMAIASGPNGRAVALRS